MNNLEKLKELRINTMLSQKEFAKMINISYSTYQSWESGRRNIPSYAISLIEKIIELSPYL